jgi:hypothetical protein
MSKTKRSEQAFTKLTERLPAIIEHVAHNAREWIRVSGQAAEEKRKDNDDDEECRLQNSVSSPGL